MVMDIKQFLAEFGHIANAPGGVQSLRELTLFLAINGELTDKQDGDSDASILYQRITEHKTQLIADKKIPKQPALNVKDLTDLSRCNRSDWYKCSLIEIIDFQKGKKPQKLLSKGKYAYVDVAAFDRGHISNYTNDEKSPRCSDEDLIIICDGSRSGFIGKAIEGVIGSTLARINNFDLYNLDYLFYLIQSTFPFFNKNVKGVRIPHLDLAKFRNLVVHLPPVEEQVRIVSKVDDLMILCNKLEEQQLQKRQLQNQIRQATLQAVASATSSQGLKQEWQRLQENFDRLFLAPEDVDELRNCVSSLILRGVFNTSSTKFARFERDRDVYIPEHWSYRSLNSLSEYITSGSRGWKKYYSNTGDAFIRSQDIKLNRLHYEDRAFVKLPEKVEGKRTLTKCGDLLITITGGNVGKCASIPLIDYDAYVSQHVALIRLKSPLYSLYFHEWVINSYSGQKFLSQFIYGDKPGLNLKQVGSIEVPLPPESEVLEILKILKSYNENFKKLKNDLAESLFFAEKLASASIASLTGIKPLQEEEPLKVPQTELVAPVNLGSKKPNSKDAAPLAALLVRQNGQMNANDLWQRFGGEIDDFYAQLKTEVVHGWLAEPSEAKMLEKEAS